MTIIYLIILILYFFVNGFMVYGVYDDRNIDNKYFYLNIFSTAIFGCLILVTMSIFILVKSFFDNTFQLSFWIDVILGKIKNYHNLINYIENKKVIMDNERKKSKLIKFTSSIKYYFFMKSYNYIKNSINIKNKK